MIRTALLLFLLMSSPAWTSAKSFTNGQNQQRSKDETGRVKAPSEPAVEGHSVEVAILPMANHTGHIKALQLAEGLVGESLESLGVSYVDQSTLRPFLRKGRIRAVGQIGRRGADALRKETGARWLLLGAVEVFRESKPLEFGLSLRLVDAGSLWVSSAVSVGRSDKDNEGIFGSGKNEDLLQLAHDTLEEGVRELWEGRFGGRSRTEHATSFPRICIIPFDGSPRSPREGATVSNLVLAKLVSAGYPCLEPGVVREDFLREGKVFKGEIDLPSLAMLAREESIRYAVTGTVETFDSARGRSRQAVPRVALSARVLDARSRKLFMTWYDEKSGLDSETLFQLGRTYSLVKLTSDALKNLVKQMEKARRNVETES